MRSQRRSHEWSSKLDSSQVHSENPATQSVLGIRKFTSVRLEEDSLSLSHCSNNFTGINLSIHEQAKMSQIAILHDLSRIMHQIRRRKELVSRHVVRPL